MRHALLMLLLPCSCATPMMLSEEPQDGGARAEVDGGSSLQDSGMAVDTGGRPLPPLASNAWEKLDLTAPTIVWEHGATLDATTQTWVQTGGHVLGGYPQSSYTFGFDPWANAFSLSTAPVRPQRMCLVDSVSVESIGKVLLSQGSVDHGSLSTGRCTRG